MKQTNIKSKLRTVFGCNRGNKIHANNGIIYKLTSSLFEEARGYYLLEQVRYWNGTFYKVLKYIIDDNKY